MSVQKEKDSTICHLYRHICKILIIKGEAKSWEREIVATSP